MTALTDLLEEHGIALMYDDVTLGLKNLRTLAEFKAGDHPGQRHGPHGRYVSGGGGGGKGISKPAADETHAATHDFILRGGSTDDLLLRGKVQSAGVRGVAHEIMSDPALEEGAKRLVSKYSKGAYDEDGHLTQHGAQLAVSEITSKWSAVSADHDKQALAIQKAVADEFGKHGTWDRMKKAMLADPDPAQRLVAKRLIRDTEYGADGPHGLAFRAIARAMYNHTQNELKAAGLTEVTVHRGFHFREGQEPRWVKDGDQHVTNNVISSYSSDVRTAKGFGTGVAGSWTGVTVHSTYPIERVFATARTGAGTFREAEFLIFDGPGLSTVKTNRG
jgi:hypothetical protein